MLTEAQSTLLLDAYRAKKEYKEEQGGCLSLYRSADLVAVDVLVLKNLIKIVSSGEEKQYCITTAGKEVAELIDKNIIDNNLISINIHFSLLAPVSLQKEIVITKEDIITYVKQPSSEITDWRAYVADYVTNSHEVKSKLATYTQALDENHIEITSHTPVPGVKQLSITEKDNDQIVANLTSLDKTFLTFTLDLTELGKFFVYPNDASYASTAIRLSEQDLIRLSHTERRASLTPRGSLIAKMVRNLKK